MSWKSWFLGCLGCRGCLGCESGPCHVDFLMMISRMDRRFFFSIWQAASPKKTQENRVFSWAIPSSKSNLSLPFFSLRGFRLAMSMHGSVTAEGCGEHRTHPKTQADGLVSTPQSEVAIGWSYQCHAIPAIPTYSIQIHPKYGRICTRIESWIMAFLGNPFKILCGFEVVMIASPCIWLPLLITIAPLVAQKSHRAH